MSTNLSFRNLEIIFKKGDRNLPFYILKSGKVLLFSLDDQDRIVPFAVIEKGKIFGEFSALSNNTESIYAICLEKVEVGIISSKEISLFFSKSPDWVGNLLVTLSTRLNEIYHLLEDHKIRDINVEDPSIRFELPPEVEVSIKKKLDLE